MHLIRLYIPAIPYIIKLTKDFRHQCHTTLHETNTKHIPINDKSYGGEKFYLRIFDKLQKFSLLIDFVVKMALVVRPVPQKFLNQVRAWFLYIAFVRNIGMRVCVSVCVSVPKAINN